MKNILTLFTATLMVAGALLLSACAAGRNGIGFTEARNYFVQRGATVPSDLKITTQADFDRCFGEAAVMGKNGQPTPIDFSRSFAIAKVLPESDRNPQISHVSLQRGGHHKLVLHYVVSCGPQRTYTVQPFILLIVDRKYKDWTISELKH